MTYMLLALTAALGLWIYRLYRSRSALQRQLAVVESVLADTREFMASCEDRLAAVERDQLLLTPGRAKTLQAIADRLEENRAEFDKVLGEEFDRACDQIRFKEVEYKKTITLKRKQHARKNAKNAKPQRVWRYIDEE